MLKNAYLDAKIGVDPAENDRWNRRRSPSRCRLGEVHGLGPERVLQQGEARGVRRVLLGDRRDGPG